MKLSKAFEKCFSEIQQYCKEHRCDNCKLHTKKISAYNGCPFRHPHGWKLNEMNFSQLRYGNDDFDKHDLYDYFDDEEE